MTHMPIRRIAQVQPKSNLNRTRPARGVHEISRTHFALLSLKKTASLMLSSTRLAVAWQSIRCSHIRAGLSALCLQVLRSYGTSAPTR